MNPSASLPACLDCSHDFSVRYLGLICLLLGTSSAIAEWHGELSVLSDYIYRGYSKNRGNPLLQGHLDYEADAGWYAGMGLSQVSFDDRHDADHADLEIKPYLGWTLPLTSDWKTELSVTGYIYNDKVFAHDSDYVEFYASLHYRDWLSARVSVAPNAYQRDVTTVNYELNYRHDILDTVQFSAGLGYYQAKKLLELEDDYFYWNAGVSWFLTSYLSLDVRYVDVNLDQRNYQENHDEFYPRLLENKYLLSLTLGF
ncbi:hypothetical protein IVG45_21660 [Methylomonas sp. LL1]|uniref:TorF family putative porin n=1 Tax=Methylomonas sp. LL1 TaxID=2785785 RepID=UPI0018C3B371|nr:TorF family putative porin [Methylomonas sp. LL1]QPK63374.1 hypothetical protein IVG45_21660 [Methylomonas sp. LL1]